jgi:hypothetical protein
MVRAKAVVDVLRPAPSRFVGLTKYKVEVWGEPPDDFVRTYEIEMKTDTMAAQEGIRRFVEEMENRKSEKD